MFNLQCSMSNQRKEFVFTHDFDAEFLGFLEFRGPHVLASEDEGGLVADAAHVLATVLFDDGLVLVATVVGEDTTDDDALTSEFVGGLCRLCLREFHLQTVVAQTFHNLSVLFVVEVGDDALCHHLTDTLYLL